MHTAVKKIQFKSAKNKKAFTLTEVIIASTLLVLAMVPILKAMAQVNMNSVIVERKTKSLNLAKMQINQLQAKSIYNFDTNFSQSNLSLGNSYLCNITSQSVSTNLKSITISVGMDRNSSGALGSDEIEITLQTQVARRQ